MNIPDILALIALVVAGNQLYLQKKEIIKNGEIATLSHLASVLRQEIDRSEKIITSLKANNNDYTGLAHKVNQKLIPKLNEINEKIINLSSNINTIDKKEIITLIKTKNDKQN